MFVEEVRVVFGCIGLDYFFFSWSGVFVCFEFEFYVGGDVGYVGIICVVKGWGILEIYCLCVIWVYFE